MAPDDPLHPRPSDADRARAAGGAGSSGSGTGDALRRLEERLDRASEAAERLILEVVQSLRELIPTDLQRRLAEALRELLLAVRALIDWYLERTERHRAAPTEVEDIPIL
jgi:hypothetical protein